MDDVSLDLVCFTSTAFKGLADHADEIVERTLDIDTGPGICLYEPAAQGFGHQRAFISRYLALCQLVALVANQYYRYVILALDMQNLIMPLLYTLKC